MEEFFCEKSRQVERSFYSLYSLGCNNNGFNFHIIANIYKKFCQSIFYYGLEINFIRKQCLNQLRVRQNTLLKNIIGISKFCRSIALMNVVKIKSINQIYEEYKILFMKQLKRNSFTKEIFETLQQRYNTLSKPPNQSYFAIIKQINNKYDLNIDVNISQNIIKQYIGIVNNYYKVDDEILMNKLRSIIHKTVTPYDNQAKVEFKLLLTVNFN